MSSFLRTAAVAAAVTIVAGGAVVVGDVGVDRLTGEGDVRALVEDDVADGELPESVPPSAFLDSLRPEAGPVDAEAASTRVILSRDPFAPVIPDGSTDGSTTDGGTTQGGTTDGGTAQGGTTGQVGVDQGTGGTQSGGQTSGSGQQSGGQQTGGQQSGGQQTGGDTSDTDDDVCTGDERETVCDGVVITLEGFERGDALVTVNSVTYPVGEGDEFATSFRVLAINQPCTTLLYGDEAFSICVGATVLK